jgi:hypothetical protein
MIFRLQENSLFLSFGVAAVAIAQKKAGLNQPGLSLKKQH